MEDYTARLSAVETSPQYWVTVPLTEFSVSLDRWLRMQSMPRARLAKALGFSRAYVTQVLRGDENLTALAMAKLAMAAGAVVHVHVTGKDVPLRWVEEHNGVENFVDYGEKTASRTLKGARTQLGDRSHDGTRHLVMR